MGYKATRCDPPSMVVMCHTYTSHIALSNDGQAKHQKKKKNKKKKHAACPRDCTNDVTLILLLRNLFTRWKWILNITSWKGNINKREIERGWHYEQKNLSWVPRPKGEGAWLRCIHADQSSWPSCYTASTRASITPKKKKETDSTKRTYIIYNNVRIGECRYRRIYVSILNSWLYHNKCLISIRYLPAVEVVETSWTDWVDRWVEWRVKFALT